MNFVHLKTDNDKINFAYYTAISDLTASIKPIKSGLLETEKPVIIAGSDYSTPWTRDGSINIMNAGGYLDPEVAENTLWAVLKKENGRILIDGEYWDAIIWVLGAWSLYLYTGDKEFLRKAFEVTKEALKFYEETEFDSEKNLFRGPGVYGDGVAAYPDTYVKHGESSILQFAYECPEYCVKQGVGLPMFTLSTNCVYYASYILADKMCQELEIDSPEDYVKKAVAMKTAINEHFWMENKGRYRYLIDPYHNCDEYMEGIGNAFVVRFGIADKERSAKVLENQHITAAGIPCVWPNFDRYIQHKDDYPYIWEEIGKPSAPGTVHYGRHCGPVWPFIQAFWGDAAIRNGREDLFEYELFKMAEHAYRDGFFAEVLHPDTEELYGGIQEFNKQGIGEVCSCRKQTWSATGYIHMIFMNVLGMEYKQDGVHFNPYLPEGISFINVTDFCIREKKVNVSVTGKGHQIDSFLVNGKPADFFIPYK